MAIAQSPHQSRSRRALLAGALGGFGAWVAGAIARVQPAEAAAGDPIRMGQLNTAGDTTTTLRANSRGSAFRVVQHADGDGIEASTDGSFRAAVNGRASNRFGFGVTGTGGHVGVRGDGVFGVIGRSPRRSGVQGLTNSGFAIHGRTRDPEGFAGYFEGKVFTSRFLEFARDGRPSAPKADHARLYVRDDGTGNLQLVVRFATGPVQVIATEP